MKKKNIPTENYTWLLKKNKIHVYTLVLFVWRNNLFTFFLRMKFHFISPKQLKVAARKEVTLISGRPKEDI